MPPAPAHAQLAAAAAKHNAAAPIWWIHFESNEERQAAIDALTRAIWVFAVLIALVLACLCHAHARLQHLTAELKLSILRLVKKNP
jgi:hypothetical protein